MLFRLLSSLCSVHRHVGWELLHTEQESYSRWKVSDSCCALVPRLLLDEIICSCFCLCSRLLGDGASSHFTFGIVLSSNIAKTEMSSGRDLLSDLGRGMEECMLLK